MFENTQKAAGQFASAVTQDLTTGLQTVQETAKPLLANVLATIASAFTEAKDRVEGNVPNAPVAPPPTLEQENAILALRKLGKNDGQIAAMLKLNPLTVAMAVTR